MADYPVWGVGEQNRFAPENTDRVGIRPSFKALLALVDTTAPEWPAVAAVLSEMQAAGVDLDEATVTAARKLGTQQWESRRRNDTRGTSGKLGLATASGSVVYYIRRAQLIKIGTTTNPMERFEDLLPDEILAVEPGGQPEEYQRHMQFHHLRWHREYFAMGDELLAHVGMVRDLHGDPDPAWPTWTAALASGGTAARASAELITAVEAERRYGIKRTTLRAMVHRGLIRPAGQSGRSFLYFADEVRLRAAR